MTTVYLLHFPAASITDPGGLGGHFLGTAAGRVGNVPDVIVRGTGASLTPAGAVVADVWECPDVASAACLRDRLARQGSRRRLCSICNPGNARGSGRGNWRKQG